jgi:phosphatidylglycerol:prolipoprotein diacylglycerol transferase
MWLFARRSGSGDLEVSEDIAPRCRSGRLPGRVSNISHAAPWGRPTDLPWGMTVPCPRVPEHCAALPPEATWSPPLHPSQLYEAGLEGIALFAILWGFSSRTRPTMAVSGLFLLCYGCFRFLVEFVRQPDAQLGYLAFGWLTMGQLLSAPMIAFGILLLFLAYRRRPAEA